MKELYQSQDPFEKKDYIPSWGPAVACDVASKLCVAQFTTGKPESRVSGARAKIGVE